MGAYLGNRTISAAGRLLLYTTGPGNVEQLDGSDNDRNHVETIDKGYACQGTPVL